jgi:tetratricopeptide (TPR) repeat protein
MPMKRILVLVLVIFFAAALLPCAGLAQSRQQGMKLTLEAVRLQNRARSKQDLQKAARKYEEALKIFEKVGDKKSAGIAFNNLGLVYRTRGQNEKAVDCYEQSLAIDRKLGNRKGEAATLSNLGVVYTDWGQYDKAMEFYKQSLAINRKLGDRKGEAVNLGGLGVVSTEWGQYAKAMEYHKQNLAIQRKLKNSSGEAQSLHNLGMAYRIAGHYAKAMEYYKQSLAILRKLKDRRVEAMSLNNIGVIYELWGHYAKAVDCLKQSLAIRRTLGDRRGEAIGLHNLGNVYSGWGHYAKAMEYYKQSLAMARKLKDRRTEAANLTKLGIICSRRGDYEAALATLHRVLKVYSEMGTPARLPYDLIGSVYLEMGDLDKADAFIKKAGVSRSLGRLHLVKTEFKEARQYYETILKSAEKSRNADDIFTAYTGLGKVHEAKEEYEKALQYYSWGMKLTEEIRSSLQPAQRKNFFDVRIGGFYRADPYEGLARVLMKTNKLAGAFRSSEYTKARVFAEAMSALSGVEAFDIPAEIVKKDQDLNDQLAALKKSRQKAYEKGNKLVIASLEPQVEDLEEKHRAHISMLRGKYPLFAATKYPEPMDLAQTGLKDNEWALCYDATDPGLIIYLTKGRQILKGRFKPIPRKELDELVRKFRQPLQVTSGGSIRKKLTSFDFASGKKLADILLGDILSDLPEGTPVMVVPDDSLGVLPFEMLVLNEGGKVKTDGKIPYVSRAAFFGDRNPISYHQSITALTLARTLAKQVKAGKKVLVMDDPVFSADDERLKNSSAKKRKVLLASLPDKLMSIKTEIGLTFPRLPLTGQLGESLKTLDPEQTAELSGMKASKPVLFKKSLKRYGSMIFATHGYFGTDLPGIQEPVLVLTLVDQPKGQDGFLRMSEVMGLKMNADIVALTACQTGLGRRISGEGNMNMGRAFQYAGARSVLMSLWSVAEKSSVMLVESFFKHRKEGKSKLESLQMARKEIREAGYDHPFYWAPFILVGEVN